MNPKELKKLVAEQIDNYLESYEVPEPGSTYGTAWSAEKVLFELNEMRKHVCDPYLFEFHDYQTSLSEKAEVKECWVVADDGFYKMFFDHISGEFVLAQQGENGHWCSWGIRGNAIDVFLSR